MLQNVFWIASASPPGIAPHGSNVWFSHNPNAFPDLWLSVLTSPAVQNNETLIGKQITSSHILANALSLTEHMIDVTLLSETNIFNPLVKSSNSNTFSVASLLRIPQTVLSRKDRTRIREGWLQVPETHGHKIKKKSSSEGRSENSHQTPSYELMPLSPDVLALKVKIMQLPTSHEVRTGNGTNIDLC